MGLEGCGAYQAPTSGSSRNTQVQTMLVVKYVDTCRPFSAPAACGTIEYKACCTPWISTSVNESHVHARFA
eukprot:COSAG04_NODE_29203_length_270_cov_0.912281_1_plen_70_part_01